MNGFHELVAFMNAKANILPNLYFGLLLVLIQWLKSVVSK